MSDALHGAAGASRARGDGSATSPAGAVRSAPERPATQDRPARAGGRAVVDDPALGGRAVVDDSAVVDDPALGGRAMMDDSAVVDDPALGDRAMMDDSAVVDDPALGDRAVVDDRAGGNDAAVADDPGPDGEPADAGNDDLADEPAMVDEPDQPPDPEPAAGGPAGRRPVLQVYIAGLAVTAVLLAAAIVLLTQALHSSSNVAQQRAAVLVAARQEASGLTNLNQRAGSREFGVVLAGSAGSLRQQLSQGRSAFLKALTANNVTSSGTVLDAGIVTSSSSTATVLLNVKATVRNKQTYAPESRLYHWKAGLVYSGGRWLMTSLEFV